MQEFTEILQSAADGNSQAAESLLNEVYTELRKLAAARMAGESPDHTLQATALVHEAWIRLMAGQERQWANKKHFFSAAAEAMRRILIDRARHKQRKKRGGALTRVNLAHVTLATEDPEEYVVIVDEALSQLALTEPVKAEVVKLRYFIGLNHAEIAEALGISVITVRRHWNFARSWLYATLKSRSEKESNDEGHL